MSFLETVARAKNYLQEHGRVSLRALKLEFELDDEQLEALVEELVDAQQVAALEARSSRGSAERARSPRRSPQAPRALPNPSPPPKASAASSR